MGLRDAAAALIAEHGRTSASVHGQGDVLPQALIDSMLESANLAAALHLEPAMSRRIRADDPLGSSSRVWDDVRARRAAECAEVLRTALAEQPEATFALVEDPSPQSWSVDGRSWVVFAPAEVFDEVLEALEALDDDEREKLERTLVMGVVLSAEADANANADAGGRQDAGGSTHTETAVGHGDRPRLGPPQCMSLGFGYQLTSSASRSALLIPADRAEELARVTNLVHPRAGVGVAQAVEKLVSRSHEAARRRMRQLADPPRPHMDTAVNDAIAYRQNESEVPSLSEESTDALARLERHVAKEEEGRTDQHLAEVLTRGARGEPLDELAASLLGALASLHFSNLRVPEDDTRQP
jgi:phenylpyruvate tautomerase PptA (4-oxalocrotonate tautomerase family)